jgi:hypothetical protein
VGSSCQRPQGKRKEERRIGGPLRGFGPEEGVGPERAGSGWAKRERSEVESFLFFFQTFSNLNLSNSSKKFPKVF